MNEVVIASGEVPATDELIKLYRSVGWTVYTAEPDVLARGVSGSALVVTARADGRLVGLARTVSDGATICLLQDILVLPEYQRDRVGSSLMNAVLEHHAAVQRIMLLTDDEPRQRAFYESFGFTEIRDVDDTQLRAFIRTQA